MTDQISKMNTSASRCELVNFTSVSAWQGVKPACGLFLYCHFALSF
jgi:hypothetical protein